ncbi:MAG: SUMF1/EgtB/PvdO family nonheme iron enzyme [Burkholderiales bacterium]
MSFGVYDMIGNVWERAEDCWIDNLAGMPENGSARTSGDCHERVMRGGSRLSPPQFARLAARQWLDASYRFADLGPRVVRAR